MRGTTQYRFKLQFCPPSPLPTAMNNLLHLDTLKILLIFLLLAMYMPLAYGQDATTVKEVPPIYLAAKQGNLSAVRSLIAEGNDVNAVNASGRSALMSAVFFSNRGIVKELLVEGANVNGVDTQGRTALMIAVSNKDIEIVELLLAAGADVAIEDKTKNTAITLAERGNNKQLIKLLEDSTG